MCDCYFQKCSEENCQELLHIHLGDFNTRRDEIQVFCKYHIPQENCRVFSITNLDGSFHYKMAIRDLTNHAKKNKLINHPNVLEIKIIDVKEI